MTPVFDIVIPVHDNLPWLKMCLTAIHAFTANPYRVVIVDNASKTPEMREFLRNGAVLGERDLPAHGRISVLHLNVNDSFSHSVNAGVRHGNAPNVVLLNSDALVTKGWDAAFLADLSVHDVGITGARGNASGPQGSNAAVLHAGPSFVGEAQARRTAPPTSPYLIFFAVAFRREVWDEVGELDGETCMGWGGGEDLDWSWRCIDAGYRAVVSAAQVIHGVSQTYASTGHDAEGKARLERLNLERLISKHGHERYKRGLKTQPKVMISIFSRTDMTLISFTKSLLGAVRHLTDAGWHVGLWWATRTMIDQAREKAVRDTLAYGEKAAAVGAFDYDYLIMVDDDHTFPIDAFYRLVSSGKDVCSAIAYRRAINVLNPQAADHGSCVYVWGDKERTSVASIEGLERTGLVKIDATGFGMVAIKTTVLRDLTAEAKKRDDARLFKFDVLGEDLGFCAAAAARGHEVWCDTDLILGHLGDPVLVDEAYARHWRQQVGLSK